jgi:hypothetical protein
VRIISYSIFGDEPPRKCFLSHCRGKYKITENVKGVRFISYYDKSDIDYFFAAGLLKYQERGNV